MDEAVPGLCAILQGSSRAQHVFIAAAALVHNFTLITRSARHFERTGVRILNLFT